MAKKLNLNARCGLMFASYYILFYVTIIMFSTYLLMAGFTAANVAALLSVYALLVLVSKPLYAALIDRGHCRALMLGLSAALAAGTGIFFFSPVKTLVTAALYVVLASASASGMMGATDSWVLKLAAAHPEIQYSSARSGGSISFAVTGLIYGSILAKAGLPAAPAAIYAALALFVFSVLNLPDPEPGTADRGTLPGIGGIFRDRRLMLFILFYAIGTCVVEVMDNYIGVLILERGGTAAYTGLHDFAKAGAEFFVMLFYVKLTKKFSSLSVLCFGMLGLFVKLALDALAPTPALIVATFVLQIIGFPLVNCSAMNLFSKLAPSDSLAMALSLSGALISLLMMCIVNPLMGVLITRFGTPAAVLAASLLGIVSAAGLWVTQRKQGSD